MARQLDLGTLLAACSDDSFEDGIRIDTELEPSGGPGSPVKPAVYEGGVYQTDRRWASPADDEPTDVIVIDNVPSQANRLEEALRRNRSSSGIPEMILDLSDLTGLPRTLAPPDLQPRVPSPQCGRIPPRRPSSTSRIS